MTFGDILRQERVLNKMSQEQLGKLVNKTKNNISQYELSKRDPDTSTLQQFAAIFDCSVDFLLGRTTIRNPYTSNLSVDPKDKELIEKTKELSPEGLKELDEMIDLLKYKDMMKKEKEDMERNKAQ